MGARLGRVVLGLGAIPLTLAAAPGAAAERFGTDLFAGYSFARIDDVDRHGGNAALGFDLVGPLSAFVDAGAHWGRAAGLDRSDLVLMAGPGLRVGRPEGTAVFVRALAGLVREHRSIAVLDVSIGEASDRFGVLAGGGVDVRVAGRWKARLQGDYLWNDAAEGGRKSGFRASAGLVCRVGRLP